MIIVPTKPSSRTHRRSSSAAASGTAMGRVANAANRPGYASTASAIVSLAAVVNAGATSAGRNMLLQDSTCMVMLLRSMSAIRAAPMSASRSTRCV